MPRIISDIDGTVLEQGQPIRRVCDWIDANAEELVFLTNRPESDRERTVEDLKATGLSYDKLIMNDTGDQAPVFKAGVIQGMLDDGERVDLFIDNDEANREAVEALGVDVMDPADIMEPEDAVDAKLTISPDYMENAKSTPEQRLKAAQDSAVSALAERDSLRKDFEALTAKHLEATAAAEKAATDASAALAKVSAERDEAIASAAKLSERISELEASQASAAKVAADKLASIGLKEPLAAAPQATPAGKDERSIVERHASIKDPAERLAFFNANKRALYTARLKAMGS